MAGPLHKNLDTTSLHVPGYQQSSDPGAIGTGKYWIDTTGGTGAWALKVRNAANSGWETVATAGTGLTAASQAQQEAGSSTTVGTTPGRQQYHPSACKGWINFNGSGTIATRTSYNVTSITDNGTGDWTVTWDTDFSTADYSPGGMGGDTGTNHSANGLANVSLQCGASFSMTAGAVRINSQYQNGTAIDLTHVFIQAFGDQA